jgi:uncharacterized sulfatase
MEIDIGLPEKEGWLFNNAIHQLRMRVTICCIGLGLMLISFSCRGELKPNILFIVADDQGSWTLSSQLFPNAWTPELDKLAAQGAVIKNAFAVGAVCSPSRAALVSGRYPTETGVTGVISTGSTNGIDTSLVLWPEILADAGYRTALVGKWHLGHANPHHFPEKNGYQEFSGFNQNGNRSMDPIIRRNGRDTIYAGRYTSDVLADLTMDYIREFGNSPWAISLHFWAPHANTRFPEGFRPTARGRSWLPMKEEDLAYWKDMDLTLPDPDFPNLDTALLKRMMREYYASVHSVDRNVGRVLQLLDDLDLARKTIVIFTSDHGYMMGQHGLWHKGNGRWLTFDKTDPEGVYTVSGRPNLFDNSVRVPFIVRWPGMVKPGSEIGQTVSFLDVYPTLLEMTGTDKPDVLKLRGKSFLPLLKGEQPEWDNTLFAQYGSLRCIQTPEWKYVHAFRDTTKNELYNLKADPEEYINLIHSTDPAVVAELKELKNLLFRELRKINDAVLK